MSTQNIELRSVSFSSNSANSTSEVLHEVNLDIEESDLNSNGSTLMQAQREVNPLMSKKISGLAVEVKEANFQFGFLKKKLALEGVNINVPRGIIYGLLGPSGCGKTTLLNVIVGQLKLKKGTVKVFGEKPCSSSSNVPGLDVGFMPQNLALYGELTIRETLIFFGRINQLDLKTIKEKLIFLNNILDLPKKSIFVSTLSGGQKRRVSLAAALIHQPPLLILDEPTVGIDPLLRQSIWNYLVENSRTEGTTVILTTHYIEEAGQANMVAMMRNGRIIVEDNTKKLIQRLQEPSLEKCFLKICQLGLESEMAYDLASSPLLHQAKNTTAATRTNHEKYNTTEVHSQSDLKGSQLYNRIFTNFNKFSIKESKHGLNNIITLVLKNFVHLRRNIPNMLIQLGLPILIVILVYFCIGNDLMDLRMAIVNEENPNEFSLDFIKTINKDLFILTSYNDLEVALQLVKDGHMLGVIHFGPTFTTSLCKRIEHGIYASNETIQNARVNVYMDMSSEIISMFTKKSLLDSFQKFLVELFENVEAPSKLANWPLSFETPIYGSMEFKFIRYFLPGTIINLTYVLALGLTVVSFTTERRSGVLKRSWVSGVTPVQVVLSQLITQMLILIGQLFSMLVLVFTIFDIQSEGSIFLICVIVFMEGIYGMTFGLFLWSIFKEDSSTYLVTIGSFFPCLIQSGCVWPVETQPALIRYVSLCFPQTTPIDALRSILYKGWTIGYPVVWTSLLVLIAWIILLLILSVIAQRLIK